VLLEEFVLFCACQESWIIEERRAFIMESRKIYSKRYLPDPEIKELMDRPQTEEERKEVEQSFTEFMRRIDEESVFVLMPDRIEKSRRFIELAKELSQRYEVSMDIWEKTYFIQVDLHLCCASYPGPMTRQFAELFNMCDKFSSFILKNEPSDFTLCLDFYTHEYYLSGVLMND
jgi:hypothetical protein